MWVSVVLGFDPDGQLVAKWREAFQRHGQLMGEFTHGEEYVKELRRHTMVSRLRMDGQDVVMPLAGVVSPNRRNLSSLPKSAITPSQSQPKWLPNQSVSACHEMRNAQGNAGAATLQVKFA